MDYGRGCEVRCGGEMFLSAGYVAGRPVGVILCFPFCDGCNGLAHREIVKGTS